MKKVLAMVAFVMLSVIVYAFNDKQDTNQGKKEITGNGEVVVMDKEMFLKDVFDYEKSKEWKYKGAVVAMKKLVGKTGEWTVKGAEMLDCKLTDELLERDMDAALKELKEEESTAMVAAQKGGWS